MTVPAVNGHGGTFARYSGPVVCPKEVAARPASGEQTQERVDEREAAALLRAFRDGNESLMTAQAEVNTVCEEVIDSFHQADGAIDDLVRFTKVGTAAVARDDNDAVLERHRDDGPEDLRRRPLTPWTVWILVGAAAAFDASFVGNLVQRVFGIGRSPLILYLLTYLPGLGMALALWGVGHVLAEHLYRRRIRVSRVLRKPPSNPLILLRRLWFWREQEATRQADDLPWARPFVPVMLAAAVLGLLGVVAYIRASLGTNFTSLNQFRYPFVVLMILLSVSVIAAKVISHNPHADRAKQATKLREAAKSESEPLVRKARQNLAQHSRMWNSLQSALTRALGKAAGVVDEACASILDERANSGRIGSIELPLREMRWPRRDDDDAREIPKIDNEILRYAEGIATRHAPELLERRLRQAIDALHGQVESRAARGDSPQPTVPAQPTALDVSE